MLDDGLMGEPVVDVLRQSHGATPHKEDSVQLNTQTKLLPCLQQDALDHFQFCLFHQLTDVMILAMQSHDAILEGMRHDLFIDRLQIKLLLDPIGNLLFDIQHAALQGAG